MNGDDRNRNAWQTRHRSRVDPPKDGDEQEGGWPRPKLVQMDASFCKKLAAAIAMFSEPTYSAPVDDLERQQDDDHSNGESYPPAPVATEEGEYDWQAWFTRQFNAMSPASPSSASSTTSRVASLTSSSFAEAVERRPSINASSRP